jgi:hypothetical protein
MNDIEKEHELTEIINKVEQATFEHIISPAVTSLSSIRIVESNTGTTKAFSKRILIIDVSDLKTL